MIKNYILLFFLLLLIIFLIILLIITIKRKKIVKTQKLEIDSTTHSTKGTHIIIDAWNINFPIFKDFNNFILKSGKENGINILNEVHHIFNSSDESSFTALYLLSESHLSIHTYPEYNYASLDIYTCGNVNTMKYANVILDYLYKNKKSSTDYIIREIPRGNRNDIGIVNDYKIRKTLYDPKQIKVLYRNQSDYQSIMIFNDKHNGNTLVIDNNIQYTEKNGPNYTKEMVKQITESNKKEKEILIIGGGDGFILDYLTKNKEKYSIKKIIQVDIDPKVLEATKQFFKFDTKLCDENKIVECIYADGSEYVKSTKKTFDFIIVDSTDPSEPYAKILFTEQFYKNIYNLLNKGGSFIQQMAVHYYEDDNKSIYKIVDKIFNKIYFTYLDTYEYDGKTVYLNGIKM